MEYFSIALHHALNSSYPGTLTLNEIFALFDVFGSFQIF